jgi:hypothetical protein
MQKQADSKDAASSLRTLDKRAPLEECPSLDCYAFLRQTARFLMLSLP